MTVKISCENTTTRSAKNEVEFISLRCVLLILPDRKTKTNTLNGLWDGEIYCKRSVLSIDIECSKARSQLSLSGGHPGRCDTAVEKERNSPLFQKLSAVELVWCDTEKTKMQQKRVFTTEWS